MLSTVEAVAATNARLETFLSDTRGATNHLGTDAQAFLGNVTTFLSGGKRFRALCTITGYATASTDIGPAIINIAAGLELFHAAALVHDDIMDRSDTRRGRPSLHRVFQSDHNANGLAGDGEHFGIASSLLGGDMLLALSDELITAGLADLPATASVARNEFNVMRRDVTMGQYLDILEEVAWPHRDVNHAKEQALHVLTYKSAKYSIDAPLRIGAAAGGASATDLDALSDFGVPLGIAFQLRDDLLGVFGDESQTGKPVGDDLREGKRTVLIAMAAQAGCDLSGLGDPHLSDANVARLQERLRDSGADIAVEALIDDYVTQAHTALETLTIPDTSRNELTALAVRVTQRTT